ncbi:hypothetical protein BJ912DRAFT_807639, partial [Pholiota molesta]
EGAREFLEKKSLLVPNGVEITAQVMSQCLHQIANLVVGPNTPAGRAVVSAIQAAATLLEDMADDGLKTMICDAVLSEVNSMAEDLQSTLADFTTKLSAKVTQHAQTLSQVARPAAAQIPTPAPYRDALMGPPMDVNPRVPAKEGIRARQLLVDFPKESDVHQMSQQEILKLFNVALAKTEIPKDCGRVRMVERLSNKGILGEFTTDAAAKWFAIKDNADSFLTALGASAGGAVVRARHYNVVAYFVPITANPDDLKEILTTNSHLSEEHLVKARWAKNPKNRKASQSVAHMLITFNHPDQANEAILRGLVLCGKKVSVGKSTKEPIRCLKCHGWNHVAAECIVKADTCGACGKKDHRTNDCPDCEESFCTPCGKPGHTSWDRQCPTFLRKCQEFNDRHLENALPFYPSTQPWTW